MSDTLDAALQAADTAVGCEGHETTDVHRTYARALIAKLIEGMDMACPFNEFGHGFNAAITEIRRRAGLGDKA